MFMAAQSAECLFSFQESGGSPTHRHLCIAVVSDAATDTPHLRIGRLDDVGRRQAARQLAGHAQPVDGEQLVTIQSNRLAFLMVVVQS